MYETNLNSVNNKPPTKNVDPNFNLKAGLFLTSVTAVAGIFAFGMTLASVKKKDPKMFDKGVQITRELPESGVELAVRALKWGTFYAVSGCSVLAYGIWKLSGANTMEEFRYKMGSILPRIPKRDVPQGRVEFDGFRHLFTYLNDEYGKESKQK